MGRCKKCGSQLEEWSNYKEMELRHGTLFSIIGSVGNAAKHMVMGNSLYRKDCDSWSQTVYRCSRCGKYHLQCVNCGNLIPTDNMPVNGKTVLRCKKCGDRNLYAHDFDMSGGA